MDDKSIKVFNMFNSLRKIDGLNKERHKKYGLNNLETMILLNIYKYEYLTQKDLVEKFKAPKQTVNTIVMNLKDKGFLETSCLKYDKRSKKLFLTDKGKEEAIRISEPLKETNISIYNDLGGEKIDQLQANLNDLIDVLEENLFKEEE